MKLNATEAWTNDKGHAYDTEHGNTLKVGHGGYSKKNAKTLISKNKNCTNMCINIGIPSYSI